ncbi:lysis protein [Yersinia frederiksenii]|uniref:lysis protein n=1 Tax=Yersinia frederiksenii TaxID=29484 RepID=UPI0005E66A54|nr:lysis protein [Yersinia frederiksenii]CNL09331.1 putative phage endopeptidase [Yersinia frederiksenii]
MNKLTAALILALGLLSFGVYYYHDAYSKADHDLTQAKQTITDMQTRQRDVAALDSKYTKELADAKSKLDDLQRCVAAGKCGLRVNVVKQATAPSGMDDAASARLTESAQRDYLSLRERIGIATSQISGLQAYINNVCLK